MINNKLKETINNLPKGPGVYLFYDINNKLLYIGKAINLKSRVSSYFVLNNQLSLKNQSLITQIKKISYIDVENEIEALVLEADLIKKLKPKYNFALKDDKYYSYLVFETVKRGNTNIKFIKIIKRLDKKYLNVLGPYPESLTLKKVIRNLRRAYPFANCSSNKYHYYLKAKKPCLYGKIGLCPAPCQGLIQVRNNNKNVNEILKILKLKKGNLINYLNREMKKYSEKLEYEKALKIKNLLNDITYLNTKSSSSHNYVNNPLFLKEKREKSLFELQNILRLEARPTRIEIYDISNTSGKNATGSMVVLENGSLQSKEYRHFKIKLKDKPNDYFMLQEVITRRFKNNWQLPNLIVIDGGKGQVSSVLKVLHKLKIQIPTIGLAKKNETIITQSLKEILINKDNVGLQLLIKGRDEAHRFALNYHRKLREKNLFKVLNKTF